MKLAKMTGVLLVSGIILTMGASVATNTTSAYAVTVVSETAYEKVMSFKKEDLNNATGANLDATSINKVYDALKKQATWTSLGCSKTEAECIVERISASNDQTVGILKDIASNESLQFKVVLVNQSKYKTVNIGTINDVVEPVTLPENEKSDMPSDSSLSSLVKEIQIDIDYKNLGDIEVDYEVKSDGRVKAEVKNKETDIKIKDTEAQKVVEDLFTGLNVKTMSNEEIKNCVLTKLNASQSGLKKFKFEVKFADKSKVDFKIKY